MQQSAWPDIIFAESVGSCADIVATVVKPFLDLQSAGIQLSSYTVFTDSRLLRRRLNHQPMPFGDDVVYIFDKQIEEAGLLVINKADLLSAADVTSMQEKAHAAFPGKLLRLQNSRDANSVAQWLTLLQSDATLTPQNSVEIDYQRYGAGEAEMAWLDQAIRWASPSGTLRPEYPVAHSRHSQRHSHPELAHRAREVYARNAIGERKGESAIYRGTRLGTVNPRAAR